MLLWEQVEFLPTPCSLGLAVPSPPWTGDCSAEGQLLAAFLSGRLCSPQDSGLSDPGQGALLVNTRRKHYMEMLSLSSHLVRRANNIWGH